MTITTALYLFNRSRDATTRLALRRYLEMFGYRLAYAGPQAEMAWIAKGN